MIPVVYYAAQALVWLVARGRGRADAYGPLAVGSGHGVRGMGSPHEPDGDCMGT